MALAQNFASHRRYRDAEPCFREALSLRKHSEVALAGLGQCLCQLGRHHEGIPYLYQAGKQLLRGVKETGQASDFFDLSYQLIHWHALAQALALAEAALAMMPNSAHAHHLAALALQGLNRPSEALPHAARAVESMPLEVNAQILLAVLEAKAGNLRDSGRRLEAVLDRGAGANAGRAHLELGNILDKTGEFDRAFFHFRQAGSLAMQAAPARQIDKTAIYRDIEGFRTRFDGGFLSSRRDAVPDDGLPSPVFLIGFYRSGSTLAEQILAAHPQVMTSGETHLIGPVLAELAGITPDIGLLPDKINALKSDQIGHLRQTYWSFAERQLGKEVLRHVFVDKTTLNTLHIELINALFPDAVVVFTVRDPRDVCLSCVMQSFHLSTLTVHLLDWRDCARFYAAVMDYWLSVRDVLSVDWLELRYEDVVGDLEGRFRPIFKKLGLEWSDDCLEFHCHAAKGAIKTPSFDQVTRPLYSSSVGRWLHYHSYFADILPILEPFVCQFGYSPSP